MSPSRLRSSGPRVSVRMVHDADTCAGAVKGAFVTVPTTAPVGPSTVPVTVPTAVNSPFTRLKLLTVRVPMNPPTPGVKLLISVVAELAPLGAADATEG